jgi:DNA-directed RNA polymerase subunit RPC12/RpoP
VTSSVAVHPWSAEALLAKALVYVGRMESHPPDKWQFGFWSTLSLELLARAALSHISPMLLADIKNWRNLTHALGRAPTAKKYSPTSIPTTEVYARLNELVPAFTEEVAGFCTKQSDRRNAELHSGELVFASLGTSQWLPRFYLACKILLESMGKNLSDFVVDAQTAEEMIDSVEDAAAKAVKQDVSAHSQVWSNRTAEDREQALVQATAWATRQTGHRVVCPACGSQALVQGKAHGTVTTSVNDDEVEQRQAMLPSAFECIACGLRISGLSKLSACGLGDVFGTTSTYTAAEFFGLYTEDELEEARGEASNYEDDFNEY